MNSKYLLLSLFFSTVLSMLSKHTSAQQLTPYQKLQYLKQASEVLGTIESESIVYFGSQTPKDEADKAFQELQNNIDPKAQFFNDITTKGSPTFDYNQYFNFLKNNTLDTWGFTWTKMALTNAKNSGEYVIKFYGKKNLYLTLKSTGQYLQLADQPCRAVLKRQANGATKLMIIDREINDADASTATNFDKLETIQEARSVEDGINDLVSAITNKGMPQKTDIQSFTYDNTGVVTDFSHKLTGLLRTALIAANKNLDTRVTRAWSSSMKLVNTYSKKGNDLLMSAQWIDAQNAPEGKPFVTTVPFSNIKDSDIIPNTTRLDSAKTINSVLTPDPLPSKLKLELITNKGKGPQTFTENDTMLLAVRVNKPCFVRLIYLDATGRLTLLREKDFEVYPSEANKWVDINELFVCSKPFGVERLIAYACTEPFVGLKTHKDEDGNTIIDNSLEEVKKISKARGMGNKGTDVAEFYIPITTYPVKM